MRKLIGVTALAMSLTAFTAAAQDARQNASTEEFEAKAVEHILEVIEVDKEQATRIAAIESEHRQAKREIHREMKAMREKTSTEEDELEKIHRTEFELRRAKLNMDEAYYNELLTEIKPSQIEQLRKAKMDARQNRKVEKKERMRIHREN